MSMRAASLSLVGIGVIAIQFAAAAAEPATAPPLRILLIAGGCCHD